MPKLDTKDTEQAPSKKKVADGGLRPGYIVESGRLTKTTMERGGLGGGGKGGGGGAGSEAGSVLTLSDITTIGSDIFVKLQDSLSRSRLRLREVCGWLVGGVTPHSGTCLGARERAARGATA